ncbi:MAG: DNA replication and repair protein RecF [Candidatus Limnocylindrales bacterium]
MRVAQLSLAGFRSYTALAAEFPAGPQVVVGDNATGKTNLLESLVVLDTGRSHRAGADGELVAWGADFSRLDASVVGSSGSPTQLEVVIALTASGGGRKRVEVNGVARRPSALSAALPVVLFAPEDMLLISGGPALRRAALDTLVAQTVPAASATFSTYSRAITQRNNLLRSIRDGSAARDELRFWDQVMIDDGARIVDWRRAALARLAEPLAAAHAEIAPAEERLELRYSTNAEPIGPETTHDALRRRLADTADKEQWNGATLIGPHRDDLVFANGERDLAGFASRGQQRTAILAFKLAQLDVLRMTLGESPLLLLDDVFSELDPGRRAHLVRRIGELPQAFVTTTTTDDLDPQLVAAATVWHVTPGRLERVASAGGGA